MLKLNQHRYTIKDLDSLLDDFDFITNNKGISYCNIPFAFDIETSSFYNEFNEKTAIMYVWMMSINGNVLVGRNWDEFIQVCDRITKFYNLDYQKKRLVIWVHNLSYEFQFICHRFNWVDTFSLEMRKIVSAVTIDGLEFRCSYILSGYSLQSVGNNLTKFKIEKKLGDLDYSLLRHSNTPLTETELGYCVNDVLVVTAYIQEMIDAYNGIINLPLTKTGFVRKYCKQECLQDKDKKDKYKYFKYRSRMDALTIQSADEYNQLLRAFSGGFTHTSAMISGSHIKDKITSYDFTSSYPSVLITCQFPCCDAEKVTPKDEKEFFDYLKCYCCLFDITFFNIKASTMIEHPLSYSKCVNIKSPFITDNGRVVDATELTTTITEQDFLVFRKFYKWESYKIMNMLVYKKDYLPTPFVKAILKLYRDKTTLKDVDDKLIEYQHAKEYLNSCYGMCVTNILRDEISFTNGVWITTQPDIQDTLDKYNKSKGRFLCYQWGVWCTAYARRLLLNGIYCVGNEWDSKGNIIKESGDYLYADTDSIKCTNIVKHQWYFDNYNQIHLKKLERAMIHHHLSMDMVKPKTIKGKEKVLGFWDFDGEYNEGIFLGAKRYYLRDESGFHLTCSGVVKSASEYLMTGWCSDLTTHQELNSPIDKFNTGLHIPDEFTGKNTHTYLDYEQSGYCIDYMGNKAYYHELSSVHLEATSYDLTIAVEYANFLSNIKTKEE